MYFYTKQVHVRSHMLNSWEKFHVSCLWTKILKNRENGGSKRVDMWGWHLFRVQSVLNPLVWSGVSFYLEQKET